MLMLRTRLIKIESRAQNTQPSIFCPLLKRFKEIVDQQEAINSIFIHPQQKKKIK